jgi:hypothetical protein
MKVLTIKSAGILDEELQTEIHYAFGMERLTDYVFKPRGDQSYSATVVLEETEDVIWSVIDATRAFPETGFIIDDLDTEQNNIERYHVQDGNVKGQFRTGWKWDG